MNVKRAKYRRTRLYGLLSKVYRTLDENPNILTIKKCRGYHGMCDYANNELSIDPRKQFIPTVIHEVLHYIFPRWSETKVLAEERKMVNSMTSRQVTNLLIRITKCLSCSSYR